MQIILVEDGADIPPKRSPHGRRTAPFPKSLVVELRARRLTQRLIEVVMYDSAGLTRKEIAARMQVVPQTVKAYWKVIYDKLQVSSREEVRALVRSIVVEVVQPRTLE